MQRTVLLFAIAISGALYARPEMIQSLPRPIDQNLEKQSQEPGTVIFNPPKGWRLADPEALPPHVRAMVVGKGLKEFPPSINLSAEEFKGTLKDYLKIVKEINASQGSDWKDLGRIRTQAGEASLSQADASTEWGPVRMLHVILERNGMIYILTAAALKEEFPKYYKLFFESLKSLRISGDPSAMAKQKQNPHPNGTVSQVTENQSDRKHQL